LGFVGTFAWRILGGMSKSMATGSVLLLFFWSALVGGGCYEMIGKGLVYSKLAGKTVIS